MKGFRGMVEEGSCDGRTSLCIADLSSWRDLRSFGRGGERERFFLGDDEIEELGEGLLFFVWFYEEEFTG